MSLALLLPIHERNKLIGHTAAVSTVKFNPRGEYIVSGGYDKVLRLWNPYNGKMIKVYRGHGYEVLDLAVHAENHQIASVGGDKVPYLWDVQTGTILRKFRGHEYRINCVAFNLEYSCLLTGSFDTTMKVWDLKSRNYDPIQTMEEGKDSITGIWCGQYEIITGSMDGRIRTYDLRMGQLRTDTVGKPISCLRVSGDGKMALVNCLDHKARLMSTADGSMYQSYTGHKSKDYPIQVTFNDTDALVVGGSEDGKIFMWKLENGTLMHSARAHSRRLTAVDHHPTRPLISPHSCLVTGSSDKTIKLWEAKT